MILITTDEFVYMSKIKAFFDFINKNLLHIFNDVFFNDIILVKEYDCNYEPTIDIYYKSGDKIFRRYYNHYYNEDIIIEVSRTQLFLELKKIRLSISGGDKVYYR